MDVPNRREQLAHLSWGGAVAQHTRVRVIMTLHPLVWGFLAIWSIFTGHLALAGLRNHYMADFYGGLGFFLFAWLMAVLVFYYDAAKSKRLLRESLQLRYIA
jgi:hypothetical protein